MENVELPEDLKNPRLLFGMKYKERYPEEEIVSEKEIFFKGNDYSCQLKGKTSDPPEMDQLTIDSGANVTVVYYTLNEFLLTGKSGKSLDLVSITPEGWKQKAVSLTAPDYKAPEIHIAFGQYQAVDLKNKECVVSSAAGVDSLEDADIVAKIGLWNTLVTRFVSEVGEPFNKEGVGGMRESILQRRKEILDALDGNTDNDPKEIAMRSFF